MTKKTKVVEKEDAETTFTQRVLMSLMVDVHYQSEAIERTKVQVFALAKEHGVHIPKWDD